MECFLYNCTLINCLLTICEHNYYTQPIYYTNVSKCFESLTDWSIPLRGIYLVETGPFPLLVVGFNFRVVVWWMDVSIIPLCCIRVNTLVDMSDSQFIIISTIWNSGSRNGTTSLFLNELNSMRKLSPEIVNLFHNIPEPNHLCICTHVMCTFVVRTYVVCTFAQMSQIRRHYPVIHNMLTILT